MDGLEDILKTVGTVVFALIYFFGGQLFKSKDADEPKPSNVPRERSDADEADEIAARQRQIQEAIRRKIMERRQADAEPAAQEPVAPIRERRKVVAEQQKRTQHTQRMPQHEAIPEPVREPVREPAEADGRFSWDASDNAYEQQMQARLQAIEATKRRAEALQRQSGGGATASSQSQPRQHTRASGALLSGSVRSVLRDPAAARTAFVYGEVLGKPVGLRPSGSGVE